MSITDELRDYAEKNECKSYCKLLTDIADRIDAEHEMATSEFWARINAVPATDENMAEHGWARLPVDADGEYIHIGDVMEGEKIGGGYGEPFTVVGYVMVNGELEPMDEHKNPRKRKYLHHHTPDTWERIIEDAMTGYTDGEFDKLVARCKALAGDGTGGRNEHH